MPLLNQDILVAHGRDIDSAHADALKILAKYPKPVRVVSVSAQEYSTMFNAIHLFVVVEWD